MLWSWLHPIPQDSFYHLRAPPPEGHRGAEGHVPQLIRPGAPAGHLTSTISNVTILWVAKTTHILYIYIHTCIIYVYVKYSLSHESSGDWLGKMDIGFYMFCHSNGRVVGIEFSTCMFDLWRCFGVNEFDPDLVWPWPSTQRDSMLEHICKQR